MGRLPSLSFNLLNGRREGEDRIGRDTEKVKLALSSKTYKKKGSQHRAKKAFVKRLLCISLGQTHTQTYTNKLKTHPNIHTQEHAHKHMHKHTNMTTDACAQFTNERKGDTSLTEK